MSKIYELYGYRLQNWNDEAENNLRQAWCPFMAAECDGGGNRYQSVALNKKEFPKCHQCLIFRLILCKRQQKKADSR